MARDCLAPRDDSSKKCYKCSETGHIARDCPTVKAEQLIAAE